MPKIKRLKSVKKEGLEAYLTNRQKAMLQLAAEIKGTTITDFVVKSAQTQARQVIDEHTGIKLSLEDSQAFAQSLLNSPEPNQRMMAKAREYKQAMRLE